MNKYNSIVPSEMTRKELIAICGEIQTAKNWRMQCAYITLTDGRTAHVDFADHQDYQDEANAKRFSQTKLEQALDLWGELGNIPVDDNDDLDEDFVAGDLTFVKGTDKFVVWHWFEETFNVSVATDLMRLS